MRSDPADFEIVTPENLQAALALMSQQPRAWLPIAGGTDVMVQFAAGTLASRKLLSIWNFPELRRIEVLPEEIRIGAGCTYTDIRRNEIVTKEFPLLARAAAWTGGIANQNRGTLGGNIVNASPAADSLPPLLVYDAELILVSVRGERRIPYSSFHHGYKQMDLAPDELIQSICLARRFSRHQSYARKVGAREVQAISKVCIAAIAQLENGVIEDARIALGSVAPVPLRLSATEAVLNGNRIDSALISLARNTAAAAIKPIDDIRSTARYRAAVVANLIADFLEQLSQHNRTARNALVRWNGLPRPEAENEILPCCGSRAWAAQIAGRRPFSDEASLLAASDEIWRSLPEADWMEAFRSHPRIGESKVPTANSLGAQRSTQWSTREQSAALLATDELKNTLAGANREYEKRFGHIFIVCASGKSADEILGILRQRLHNDAQTELREAAEQQRLITHIRLRRWLAE